MRLLSLSFLVRSAGPVWLALALLVGARLSLAAERPEEDPKQIEVKGASGFLTYVDGQREQRAVEQGQRFEVVRRVDTYYLVKDGERLALVPIASTIAVEDPDGKPSWDYVVTTANAPLVIRSGRSRRHDVAPQGAVLEVLGKPLSGGTLFVLTADGGTAEISARLVRPARPEERPRREPPGRLRGPVPLGCQISFDRQRQLYVDYVYAGSLAERMGLEPGSRILKVNGREVHSAADYDAASGLLGGNLLLLIQRRRLDFPELIRYTDPRNQ